MSHVHAITDIRNWDNITLGDCVIQIDCWLNAIGKISIGDGTDVGRRTTISSAKKITIGKNVLISQGVVITDHNHEYKDTTVPIKDQGITKPTPITIGDGAWIGANAVVMASVGRNSVIGANSTVTHDIPDFCVAAGSPAKIIKHLTN